MKKALLLAGLLLSTVAAQRAQAQVGAIGNLLGSGLILGQRAIKESKLTPAQKAAQQAEADKLAAQQQQQLRDLGGPAVPTELHAQRTPADKLPKKGAEQIQALEAQLEACRAALQASPTGAVCTPAQRAAIQQAAIAVARAQPGWDLHPYQQEMAFYAGEDARRQQAAATPAAK